MDRVLDIDTVAQTATAEAGIYGPALERALEVKGLTLGHHLLTELLQASLLLRRAAAVMHGHHQRVHLLASRLIRLVLLAKSLELHLLSVRELNALHHAEHAGTVTAKAFAAATASGEFALTATDAVVPPVMILDLIARCGSGRCAVLC